MSRKTTVGYGKSRRTRIIRVAPITHAVRLALAASATVFALAGSGAALAQACTDEADNTVYCDGALAEPVAYENVDDLTVVLGANSPTSVTVTGESTGVLVSGTGTLGITSDADVTLSSSDTALGLAVISADRYGVVEASNSGDVVVEAPLGTVAGMYAKGGVADIGNSGTLTSTTEDGRAFGIHVRSRDATVDNSGPIASTSQSGIADGMYVFGQTADVTNSGTISASGAARAAGIAVWGRFAPTVMNCGDITATSEGGSAHGIAVRWGDGGKAMASNCGGDITVTATGGDVGDNAIGLDGRSFDTGYVSLRNHGDIAVSAVGGVATGIYGEVYDGVVRLVNGGAIDAFSAESDATGMRAAQHEIRPVDGSIGVSNSGSMTATTEGMDAVAAGVRATTGGEVWVANAGSMTAISEAGYAVGIHAEGAETRVSSTATGTIDVTAYRDVAGIQAIGDIATVDNAGLIEATGGLAIYGSSTSTLGVMATGQTLVSVDNTGRVEASGSPRTIAIYADANATGPEAIARVSNAGDVIATSPLGYNAATGIAGISADDVEVTNTGSIQAIARGAIGIYAYGDDLVVVNAGTIAANGIENLEYHSGSVSGIVAFVSYQQSAGTIEITTLEGSSITAESQIYASGIIASGGDAIRIDNAGDISVVDDFDPGSVDFGFGASYGIRAGSSPQIDIDNSGEITVDVTVGPATGIVAGGFSIDIVNNGGIDVYSDGVRRSINSTDVYGIRAASGGDATVVNNGDIDVGNGFGTVFGIYARTRGDAAVRNDGTITVTGLGGYGIAYPDSFGINVRSPDAGIQVDNTGQIAVMSPGAGSYGNNAIGIFADGGEVMVTNTGSITTYSQVAHSVGVATQGDVLTVVNHGDIHATTGTTDPYNAIGVQMDATTSATFNNTGTITTTTANGVGSGVAVLIESDGAINFSNTGTLLGAVITRGGDDVVTGQAGSKWTLSRQTTDLGAGDDRIRNLFGSTLDLDSGRIVLGEGRNSFVNHGLVRVQGDSLIDMGRHAGTGDSRGWNAFINNGVIDLAGASNDDRLTLAGDLAGRGAILVGLGGHGARRGGLMVEGSVRPGSVQTVNVQFTGFDAIRQGARTDFAFVQRDSTAGSFVGGEVLGFEAGNFLELGVDVDSQIDTSNQRDDVFSASVQAEGLDDSGRLAASLGAGAQSLLAAQIGTWRQRSGVLSGYSPDRAMTGFVRSFGGQGEISQMYTGNAGQRSDFGFGQRNAGAEMGMHYQPAAGFSMGMRVGKSEGQQTLTGVGNGLNWIQADTFGVYGTWFLPKGPNGVYVDASAWRMDFDSRMQSSGSRHDVRGDASAINVETGYAFRLPGGLRVEPSLQYTWTRIDGLSVQGSQSEFRSEAGDWRRARAGVLAWKPIGGGSGMTWTPYGSISVVHTDASGASYTVSDVFNGGTSMGGASTLLELGLGLRQRGFSANAGLNWTSGDTVGNALGGQVLLHYGW